MQRESMKDEEGGRLWIELVDEITVSEVRLVRLHFKFFVFDCLLCFHFFVSKDGLWLVLLAFCVYLKCRT